MPLGLWGFWDSAVPLTPYKIFPQEGQPMSRYEPVAPTVANMPASIRVIYDTDPNDYRAQAWLSSLPIAGSGKPGDPFVAFVPVQAVP
jgi:hypothetical protein